MGELVNLEDQGLACLSGLLRRRDELTLGRASGIALERAAPVLGVHLHQLLSEPAAGLLHAVCCGPCIVSFALELADAAFECCLLLRHLQLDLAALRRDGLLHLRLILHHLVQLVIEVLDLRVLLCAELLPVFNGLVELLRIVLLSLQALLEGLLVLREVARQDVEASRALLHDLEALLEGSELILELLVAALVHIVAGRHEFSFALRLLQALRELLVLPLEPCDLLSDSPQVVAGLGELSLRLRLVADGLVPRHYGTPKLVDEVGHLIDLVPELIVASSRLKASLQQSHLVDVRLAHLAHHLHGLLGLFVELRSLALGVQQLLLE
mmetsp:Transcript_60691/g.130331  ORF Transcript_60691/g.130331 Transcript_60691/m.130331 type:complete len:326 (+) Transcript_60691:575-1552(+)